MKLKKLFNWKTITASSVVYMTPVVMFAANINISTGGSHSPDFGYIDQFLGGVGDIIAVLIKIVGALAVLFFFYGLAMYVLAAGDEEKEDNGKEVMKRGIIAIFIIAAIWGIIAIIGNIVGVDTSTQHTFGGPNVENTNINTGGDIF